ncbi:oxidoreductase, short chain dehydrogenase/reductase family [Purpureocillium lavendulum]|uniref:Oxidoreductase, short chain dehydrogenase/reductase family n=1 Tax=Purpureocillium lavendulum TaxID=1247861 RepID=A0AB34FX04_9HYPO|nr:oxidoreductase, short chain dehydrogenase/reductase family [Purpureocillium lavendulum]
MSSSSNTTSGLKPRFGLTLSRYGGLSSWLSGKSSVDLIAKQGEDGFLISTPGACLTDEQIDDICRKSKELWDKQMAAKVMENPSKSLKRPLHQPVLVSRSSEVKGRSPKSRQHADRWRVGG